MRREYTIVIILVSIVAIIAVGISLMEYGQASRAQTDNTQNVLESDMYIEAIPNGDIVQIPRVTYVPDSSEENYHPTAYSSKATGKLVVNARSGSYICVTVGFDNPLSWSLIEEMSLKLKPESGNDDDWSTYEIYNARSKSSTNVKPSELIPISGSGMKRFDYSITVMYMGSIKANPADFDGANMKSDVRFMLKDLTAENIITVTFHDGDNESFQYLTAVSPYLKNPFKGNGKKLLGWDDDNVGEEEVVYADGSNIFRILNPEHITEIDLYAVYDNTRGA